MSACPRPEAAGRSPVALIAEDEPILARTLQRLLVAQWPDLTIAAVADNGRQALQLAQELLPDLLFLDIRMPGLSGLDVAQLVVDNWPDDRAEPLIVFVTAYDEFAVEAFQRSAIDYLLKPVAADRLGQTVRRIKQRLAERAARPGQGDLAALFQRLQALVDAQAIAAGTHAEPLKVLRAAVGSTVRMIPVEDVICLETADKYVNIVTGSGEAVLRISLRELLTRIDSSEFIQVHRAIMVRTDRIMSAHRDEAGHTALSFKGLSRPIRVSRAFAHLFRPIQALRLPRQTNDGVSSIMARTSSTSARCMLGRQSMLQRHVDRALQRLNSTGAEGAIRWIDLSGAAPRSVSRDRPGRQRQQRRTHWDRPAKARGGSHWGSPSALPEPSPSVPRLACRHRRSHRSETTATRHCPAMPETDSRCRDAHAPPNGESASPYGRQT